MVLANIGQHKANKFYLKRVITYPERCPLSLYVVISNLTNTRLDIIIRMAFDITIPTSPYFNRKEFSKPHIPKQLPTRTVTKQMKEVGKKSPLIKYVTERGYTFEAFCRHYEITEDRLKENRFNMLDCIKAAMITQTKLSDVLNYIIFGRNVKNPIPSNLYCREEALADIPLVIPDKGIVNKKTFMAALYSKNWTGTLQRL